MKANSSKSAFIHLVWIGVLVLGAWYFVHFAKIVSDISQFMPRTSSNTQLSVLLNEIQQGSASRYILIRLNANTSSNAAKNSRQLKQYLTPSPFIAKAQNGGEVNDINEFKKLYAYRFILNPGAGFSENSLRLSLEKRLSELAEGMGLLLKETLASDPQNRFIDYLRMLAARGQPNHQHGVWFDKDNKAAMLLVTLSGEGYDLNRQEQAISYIKSYVKNAPKEDKVSLEISGAAVMAVATREEIQSTMKILSFAAGGLMFVLFFWGYRSLSRFFIAALPLVTAILMAVVVTNLVYDQVHGIVLAFGITLLGVCLDYPLHLFSHLKKNEPAAQTLQSIWPTLRLSVLTTAFSYMALFGTDFTGLSQLAVFAISGLITALIVTRWVVPLWIKSLKSSYTPTLIRFTVPASYKSRIIIICVVLPMTVLLTRADYIWSDDISSLSPIPKSARLLDQDLRTQLSAPEVSHAFFVQANDLEVLLQKVEDLSSVLNEAKSGDLVKHVFSVTDILPSQKIQMQRQKHLPQYKTLSQSLDNAMLGLPFKRVVFDKFVADVEKSKSIRPLVWQDLQETPLAETLKQDLFLRDGKWNSIIRLAGINNVSSFTQWLQTKPVLQPHYINMRSASSELMQEYQHTALLRLSLGILLIAGILFWVSRSAMAVLRLVTPIILAVLITLSIQVAIGTPLTLFHILALLLVIGMGLDYSLFFNRPVTLAQDLNMRTHGVMMSAGSTLAAFGTLAFTNIPVLAAMGQTVSIGVLCCYVLSQLLAEPMRQN